MNTAADNSRPPRYERKLVMIVVTLALFLSLLLVPGGGTGLFMGPWFWFMVLSVIVLLWSLLAAPDIRATEPPQGPRMIAPDEQPAVVREVMDVDLAEEERGIQLFRGRLRESAETAFEKLRVAFGGGTVPLVRPDDRCGAAIVLLSRPVETATLEHRVRPWLHWTLFGLTFLTTTWAGAVHQGIDVWREPARIVAGLPYSIALLAILGVHELGHYWTARRHQMNVTPPFFVPIPFALGTFGAFIQMRSPAENRRTLFDVAVAGPLAGLVVAIPALLIGLRTSEILPPSSMTGALSSGALPSSSILFAWLAHLSFGDALGSGDVIRLSPLAFAGWLGLFITGLNLLPVGQLDGGHIARAMFGSRAGAIIGGIAMWSLVLLGLFVWPGLLTWALVVFFIAGRGTPPLNDITRITPARFWLGCFAFVILLLIMVPAKLVELIASHCPYI